MGGRNWTTDEWRFLRTHAGFTPLRVIASQLGRTVMSCRRAMSRNEFSAHCPRGDILSVGKAAKLSDLNPTTIRRMCRRGQLVHIRTPRGNGTDRYLLDRKAFEAWVDQHHARMEACHV